MISRQKGIFKYVFLVFAVVIVIADLCLILMHGKTFSENENRMLQQFPEATKQSVLSGRFMTQAEDFVADQFFLRDNWISLKLEIDKLTGKKESNNIILGKDGYLIEKAAAPDFEAMDRNLAAIRSFASSIDQNVVMSVVPNAVSVRSDLLPAGIPVRDQREDLAYIQNAVGDVLTYADVTDALSGHNEEQVYYRSDHHWTSLGAKYAFDALCAPLGIEAPVSSYEIMTVTQDFSGTLSAGSGAFSTVRDPIDIYVPVTDENFEYVAEYGDIQQKSATIYNSAALASKNKYEVFMGGNYSYVSIKTTAQSEKNLLLFKDSYANTFVQFLLPYYRNIVIIDPRYYSDDCIKLLSEREITDVLFLYNMNTFALDNSLAGVLEP